MHAYSSMYLADAQENLGALLDYLCRLKEMPPKDAFGAFISSPICKQFERGNPAFVSGRSGVELAWQIMDIKEETGTRPAFGEAMYARSTYYWAGWALAYYQWSSCVTFSELEDVVGIQRVLDMYNVYHEMDIRQFCDAMDALLIGICSQTRLAKRRAEMGYSQSQLATISGVSLRTIQHYEQRQKDINKAQLQQVMQLAQALFCEPIDLIEPISKERYDYACITLE